MDVKQANGGGWYITRDALDVPVGLTGLYNTKEMAELAIAWYYSQNVIA